MGLFDRNKRTIFSDFEDEISKHGRIYVNHELECLRKYGMTMLVKFHMEEEKHLGKLVKAYRHFNHPSPYTFEAWTPEFQNSGWFPYIQAYEMLSEDGFTSFDEILKIWIEDWEGFKKICEEVKAKKDAESGIIEAKKEEVDKDVQEPKQI